MAYRTLKIDDRRYEYAVGKTHVKIRGADFSTVLGKDEVGQPIGGDVYVVSPSNIRNVIEGRPGPNQLRCEEHGVVTTRLAYDPLTSEIEGKGRLIADCPKCIERLAWEI